MVGLKVLFKNYLINATIKTHIHAKVTFDVLALNLTLSV